MSQKTVIKNLLQSVTDCYYKVRQVLQSVTDCYYKVRQVLQSVTVITNVYYTTNVFLYNSYRTQGAALSSFTLSEAAARGIL